MFIWTKLLDGNTELMFLYLSHAFKQILWTYFKFNCYVVETQPVRQQK